MYMYMYSSSSHPSTLYSLQTLTGAHYVHEHQLCTYNNIIPLLGIVHLAQGLFLMPQQGREYVFQLGEVSVKEIGLGEGGVD